MLPGQLGFASDKAIPTVRGPQPVRVSHYNNGYEHDPAQ